VWNVESGDVVANLEFASASKGRRGVADIDWHPRSEEIAVACADVRVRFWNARTGRESRETELVMADPQRVLFDPSGERLLVRGKRSGTAVVLDLATKTRSQNENMHEPPIITVDAFSADGRLVLSGSRDCTLYVWDAQTGRPLVQRVGSRSPVVSAAFNIDGSSLRVIAGREDGTVSIWPVDPLPAAKARKPRELTALERRREAKLAEPLEYE
jgi:WD40 repeat protein